MNMTRPLKLMTDPLRTTDKDKEYQTLRLGFVGELGDTLAEFEGGRIGVFGGIPGELARVRIYRYRRRKQEMVSGVVSKIIEPSRYRVGPPCPNFGPCSGCQWQHIEYSHQLNLKRQILLDRFSKYKSLRKVNILNTHPSPTQFQYRNHARFTVRFGGQMGFSNRITRRFVRIDECMIMDRNINDVLDELQDKVSETTNLSVRVGINTKDRLIQPTLDAPNIPFQTGQKWYIEKVKGRKFRIASPSFFQVNTLQAEWMIDLVGDYLSLNREDTLVDAYAGVGTFASILASRAGKVIAIEESSSAVDDGEAVSVDVNNLEFIVGRTENVLNSLRISVDALILDPPRVGCHPEALNAVIKIRPSRLVYVSCDPSSLARDLDILAKGGYEVIEIQPVDMFPQTYHIECVANLRYAGESNRSMSS